MKQLSAIIRSAKGAMKDLKLDPLLQNQSSSFSGAGGGMRNAALRGAGGQMRKYASAKEAT